MSHKQCCEDVPVTQDWSAKPASAPPGNSAIHREEPASKELPTKPPEIFKLSEEPNNFPEPPFISAPKPILPSPKISPSSIPNPNPSVTTTKQVEPGYTNYGSYLYSIPGYSAFQPINHQSITQHNQTSTAPKESTNTDLITFPRIVATEVINEEKNLMECTARVENQPLGILAKPQTDFEEQFTNKVISPPPAKEVSKSETTEPKLNITALIQSSDTVVTIPLHMPNKDTKKKPAERFSLKTSIPISKLDMKCVNSHQDTTFQNNIHKKVPFPLNQGFKEHTSKKVEIQSNIILRGVLKESEIKEEEIPPTPLASNLSTASTPLNNNISTLIHAAEAINKKENQFWKPEPVTEVINDEKDPLLAYSTSTSSLSRCISNPFNTETNRSAMCNKTAEANFSDQKNQILFIQNKSTSNPKMLFTIQQQHPQVFLEKRDFDSKNMLTPSRLLNQNKRSKEDLLNENSSSKVVSLKRMHQENCDENDFENLITENQIYGNKIVVKEKSQGISQEQDLKHKAKSTEKLNLPEAKNVVLQSNILYLSNVQFPANLMMIKNSPKVNQSIDDSVKALKNENTTVAVGVTAANDPQSSSNSSIMQNVSSNKEIHIFKSNNNTYNTPAQTKTDIVFQTSNTKVIMNPQIVYQVPMIVDTDSKLNTHIVSRDYSNSNQNKKDHTIQVEQTKPTDKLFIACPYQMDPKMQPKIVITNIRPTIAKVEEVSALDLYEKRKRMRRLKYLSNRDPKDTLKSDTKKGPEKTDHFTHIITPNNVRAEVSNEFAKKKQVTHETSSESDSEYGEDELNEYNAIIDEYKDQTKNHGSKIDFLFNLRLATHEIRKEKELDREERTLKRDSVAAAYIAAGRLDRLCTSENLVEIREHKVKNKYLILNKEDNDLDETENLATLRKKQMFLAQLQLTHVSPQYRQDYERTWEEIMKERERRNGNIGTDGVFNNNRHRNSDMNFDPDSQLEMLTQIKKCVNDNNNLIKMKLDSILDDSNLNEDSISELAEKNFSELHRLSKMADRSVKLYSGKETRKRDLNPGFDSENIKRTSQKLEQPFNNYQSINIPDISKIISLKSACISTIETTTQATSMDEPQNSAAGVKEMFNEKTCIDTTHDFSCQVEEILPWPGVDAIMKSYREYDAARKRELAELQRRNTALRVESAQAGRAAARNAELARALLAERRALAHEEAAARGSVQRLWRAVDLVRSYQM